MSRLAQLLALTYRHQVTALRPAPDGEEEVCRETPCALSRSAQVSAPTPPGEGDPLPESRYRYSLYTRPETVFQLGDRVVIAGDGMEYGGKTSDSFLYPSHAVTVVELLWARKLT